MTAVLNEVTTHTVDVENIGEFQINMWSAGTGSPVLFLHGYERHPGGASFLRRLAQNHTVYAPEQPGYGSSTGFNHIKDIFDSVLFYRALVESLGIEQIDVIGHSSGGMIAGEFAAMNPQLVRKLVLVDSFGLWIDDEPALDPFGVAADVRQAKWHDTDKIPSPEPTIFVEDAADPFGAMFFQSQNLGTATKFMWPIADRGLRRRLPYIKAPTLVVNGASDGLVTVSYAKELTRLIPNARLVVVENAGHYPMFEAEDTFVTAVSDFLGE
jgi:pimeloyl-ACP methyl ester carboxylesterase